MKHLLHIWMSCLLLVVTTACEKDTLASIFAPQVETGTAENIYRKGATLSGNIKLTETTVVEHYGILFSELQSMAEYEEIPITTGEMDFSVTLQDLEPGETYYFCSYAHSGHSIIRGEVRSFTTSQNNAPVFQTPTVSNTTEKSFSITATLLDDGGSELMLSGFCYNEASGKIPTFMDKVANVELSGSSITATITGLTPSTTYQIRAYGASGNGLAYSDLVTVTTEASIVPFLNAVELSDSTYHSATIVSSVYEAGSAAVTQVGFCYSSTNQSPTLNDNMIPVNGYSGGNFETTIDGLTPNTTYYIRSYAINEYGTGYSEVFTYTPAQPEVAYLVDGSTFNERIKQLANEMASSRGVYDTDNHIAKIEFSMGVQTLPEKYVAISADNSPAPAYASFNPTDSLLTVFTPAKDLKIVDASYMFYGLASLHTINWGNFKINETTVNTSNMFNGCSSLTTLDISNWNTFYVTNMSSMFTGCYKLTTLNISNWNTSKVTNMNCLFGWCHSLTSLDLSQWNVSQVTDMQETFIQCTSLVSLNLSNWDVSRAGNLTKLFKDCFDLNQLDMSNWVLNENVDYTQMFEYCSQNFSTGYQRCKIICTQAAQDFLLNNTAITGMEASWFIWTNGTVDNDGSSIENMPNQDW